MNTPISRCPTRDLDVSDLAILVPVLARPQHVERLLVNVERTTPGARLVFIVNDDDHTERRALDRFDAEHLVLAKERRRYSAKINDALPTTMERHLFLGADDLCFHPGWYERARALLDDHTLVVGTNDLTNPRVLAGLHSTHSLIDRRYARLGTIDDPERLLHEGYPHEYVDDEFVGTALHRGAMRFCRDSIVEHLHPYRGLAPVDATYRLGWKGRAEGATLFKERRPLWR